VVIAIVDTGGNLVMLERLDNAQFGTVEVARQQAWSAAAFRRPTKVFQDAIADGGANLRLLSLEGASPLEGGIPLVVDGQIIGAIGVSGMTGEQDAQIAQAGVDSLAK
jgi:glc operon protein GlcG